MKRELKLPKELSSGGMNQSVTSTIPMKRELKLLITAPAAPPAGPRYIDDPHEEGTETRPCGGLHDFKKTEGSRLHS